MLLLGFVGGPTTAGGPTWLIHRRFWAGTFFDGELRVARFLPEPRCSSVGLLVSLFRAVALFVVPALSRKTASDVKLCGRDHLRFAVGDLPVSLEARRLFQGGLSVKMPLASLVRCVSRACSS